MTVPSRNLEPILLGGVRIGISLVLLTPLVTAQWTLYPFSVGKALYARVLIAVVFGLWAVLALAKPRWRPRRSALLAALAAGLVAAALSAFFGVSPQQSWWSSYERMLGVVDAAHWAAFALVVSSVARSWEDWTRLLNLNLAIGLCVSLLAIARYLAPELPLPIPRTEGYWPRIGASAGNPIPLGAYLQAIALLAMGFLVRSRCTATVSAPARGAGRAARRSKQAAAQPASGEGRGLRLFWAVTAVCALAGVSLTGSLGAFTGLAGGLGSACALYALFGRARRSRRRGLAGLGALAALVFALALVLVLRGPAGGDPAFDNPMLERATSTEEIGVSAGNRLRIWESGLKGFAERPLLGWGPENYFVASARHISTPQRRARVQYHAHNQPIEEAVGKGAIGLAAWLALWALSGLVTLRAARRIEDARERALAVFAAAALAGWLVQSQTAFYSAESWLQHMLLLGFLVHLEAGMRSDAPGPGRLAALSHRFRPFLRRAGRILAGAAALGLAAASVMSSVAIHAGAAAMWRADHGGPFIAELERAIGAFEPLATGPRVVLFNNLALNWEVLAQSSPGEAERLLALADAEVPAALAAQPESWVLHHALARLYLKVASTHPDYAARAQRHLDRSRVLAPNLDPMEAPQVRTPARVNAQSE